MKDVVTKRQRAIVLSNEISADGECLCKAARFMLLFLRETNTPFLPIAQKPPEGGNIVRG